jgi:hypothetical protein
MPASAPGPSSGAGRIPLGADHTREDHLAELVLHVAQRQAGEDGLAEIRSRAAIDAAAIRASAWTTSCGSPATATGSAAVAAGSGSGTPSASFRYCVTVFGAGTGRGQAWEVAGMPARRGPDVPAQACGAFTPGPTSSALTWPADVAAEPANGCHPAIWQDQLGGLVLLPHLVGHVLGRLVLDLPRQVRRDDSQVASDDLAQFPDERQVDFVQLVARDIPESGPYGPGHEQ